MTVPIPQRKPDITANDVSWSDRLFNTVTGVFEAVSEVELSRYIANRLGTQSEQTQQATTQQQSNYAGGGSWSDPNAAYMSQNNQMVFYVAAAALAGTAVLLIARS